MLIFVFSWLINEKFGPSSVVFPIQTWDAASDIMGNHHLQLWVSVWDHRVVNSLQKLLFWEWKMINFHNISMAFCIFNLFMGPPHFLGSFESPPLWSSVGKLLIKSTPQTQEVIIAWLGYFWPLCTKCGPLAQGLVCQKPCLRDQIVMWNSSCANVQSDMHCSTSSYLYHIWVVQYSDVLYIVKNCFFFLVEKNWSNFFYRIICNHI